MNGLRIAHLSDIHYCDRYLEEVDRCMVAAIDYLSATPVDAIVLSGDTFDHRLEQNSPALLAALLRVQMLADIAPVLILQGTLSHDAPHAIDVFRRVRGMCPIYVANHIEQVALSPNGDMPPLWNPISDGIPLLDHDMALFSCLPSINKGNVAAAVGAENAAHAVGEQVANLLQSWAPTHQEARRAGIPTIVVSHGTVSGSLTEHGVPMAGLDHEFSVGTLFAAKASAVMLGHIHKAQEWEREGRRIAYPGSLGRLHFGEMDAKGFLVWDVTADTASYAFIETPAKELIDIDFTGAPDMEEIARIAAKTPAHAHVRIRWSVDEEFRSSIDKVAIAALFSSVAEIKLEGRIQPVQRQRCAGIGQSASLVEKLQRWCELTNTTFEPLRDRLIELQAHGGEPNVLEQHHAA